MILGQYLFPYLVYVVVSVEVVEWKVMSER